MEAGADTDTDADADAQSDREIPSTPLSIATRSSLAETTTDSTADSSGDSDDPHKAIGLGLILVRYCLLKFLFSH